MFDWIASFNQDCTLWFDRILWWDWSNCCIQHDYDYSIEVLKKLADEKLRDCVNGVLVGMGNVMWIGVSALGGFWYVKAKQEKGR